MNRDKFTEYLSLKAGQFTDQYYDGEIGEALPRRALEALENVTVGEWSIETAEQRLQILHWIATGKGGER